MPIVVDEVVISVEVEERPAGGGRAVAAASEDKQTIIVECVERVLEILAQKEER